MMSMNQYEKKHVIEHSIMASYSEGVMTKTTRYCGEIFKRFMNEGSVLELGPAEGVMTDFLFPYFEDYTVVDGADFFIDSILEKHPSIKGYSCLFEDFSTERKFDNIILGHVLEHVSEPTSILRMCYGWLAESGRILAAVPNSSSIHRQAAVKMGLLEYEKQLNETDKKNGHRRVYDMDELKEVFVSSGFSIVKSGGYWLKPLSNGQINEYWNDKMIDAFLSLGEQYIDIAGEIYIVASKGTIGVEDM